MEDAEITDLLKKYETMFKMFRKHVKKCASLRKEVLDSGDFDE